MALLGQTIIAADLPVGEKSFDVLPAGEYTSSIRTAELCTTKAGNGQYIKLQLSISGPSHAGRVVFANINVRNASQKAEEIGRQQLGDIMRAIGVLQLNDTDQLVGGSMAIKLSVKDDPQYGKSNEVKAFKAVNGSAPPMPSSQASGAAKPAAAAGSAPPWARR